jgi:hypothetical protein
MVMRIYVRVEREGSLSQRWGNHNGRRKKRQSAHFHKLIFIHGSFSSLISGGKLHAIDSVFYKRTISLSLSCLWCIKRFSNEAVLHYNTTSESQKRISQQNTPFTENNCMEKYFFIISRLARLLKSNHDVMEVQRVGERDYCGALKRKEWCKSKLQWMKTALNLTMFVPL